MLYSIRNIEDLDSLEVLVNKKSGRRSSITIQAR